MRDLRRLLLACALVPLAHLAPPMTASAEDGLLQLAQDTPACTPGDPNCPPLLPVEPEVAPPPVQEPAPQPEVQPEPAPLPEVQPEPAPQPEVQPEPAPQPEVQPEPAPQPEVQPEPAPQPEVQPEPAPQPEVQPEPAPQPEVQPEPAPQSEVQPEPEPQPEVQPVPEPQPEVQPTPEPQPEIAPPSQLEAPAAEVPAARPAGKPDHKRPRPEHAAPDAGTPPPAPDAGTPPPAPDAGTPPPPPGGAQVLPSAPLVDKMADPGTAAAAAINQSTAQPADNLRDVQRERRVISNDNGVQVTVEPGGRIIVQSGDQAVIRHDDRARFDRGEGGHRERRMHDGRQEVTVGSQDGGHVRTIYDRNGMVVQRERVDRDGRAHMLFGNRQGNRRPDWQAIIQLPPARTMVPRERYRVELRNAPPMYVEEALTAPPLARVSPEYTLDQVIYSPDLRARVRSVDLDTVTFSSGVWGVEANEVPSLQAVAEGIQAALRANPNEVFLVEGHTDAVGSVIDNLSLSDRRAEAVANVLTDYYRVPPENLVTQGYGEGFLKVQTQAAERANRRVTVRRITPLLANTIEQ